MSSADPLFQNSLQDLVKGIRANKKDPSAYISQAIATIKIELKSTDAYVKSEAVSFNQSVCELHINLTIDVFFL